MGMEVAGWILFVVGSLILFFGVGEFRDAPRRILARMLEEAKGLREAAPGELVRVRGRVVPSESGALDAPVTGKPAVWFRVNGSEDESTSGESSFKQFMDEVEGRAFFVVDGLGGVEEGAEAIASGVNVADSNVAVRVVIGASTRPELDAKRTTSTGPVTGVPALMQAFLDRKGVSTKTELGFERRREYKEERLAPGDEVLVIGRKPAPPGPQSGAYREAPEEPEALAPALVTTKSDGELALYAAGEFSKGRAMIGIGVTLAGAILLVLSLRS
jgi:hypothetical protein